ncbi:MAG: hypothetical protein K2X01_11035 [Cyanobacteria bacterium]|nr:hypothetical protein [Cyanobacteriota bacterium]
MAMPELAEMVDQVKHIEAKLTHVKSTQGENSKEYKELLKSFAVAWFVLKQSREQSEFIDTLTAVSR